MDVKTDMDKIHALEWTNLGVAFSRALQWRRCIVVMLLCEATKGFVEELFGAAAADLTPDTVQSLVVSEDLFRRFCRAIEVDQATVDTFVSYLSPQHVPVLFLFVDASDKSAPMKRVDGIELGLTVNKIVSN